MWWAKVRSRRRFRRRPQVPAAAGPAGDAGVVHPDQPDMDRQQRERDRLRRRAGDQHQLHVPGFTSTSLGANATSSSATGLAAGTTYWFRVRATDAAGPFGQFERRQQPRHPRIGTGTGLCGDLLRQHGLHRRRRSSGIDPTVNFDWGTGSRRRASGRTRSVSAGPDRFRRSSRVLPVPDRTATPAVRLWVDNRLLINNWKDHPPTTDTSAVLSLTGGPEVRHPLEYYENDGVAVAIAVAAGGRVRFRADPEDATVPGATRWERTVGEQFRPSRPHRCDGPFERSDRA